MRIVIGADHGGYELKTTLAAHLKASGHELLDVGAHKYDSTDDYPDFAGPLANAVAAGEVERGILICGSGVGASIAATKVSGVRAGLCHDTYSAHQGVEHDDMNVLCLGARIIGIEVARELVDAFVGASFSGDERHVRRLNKVLAIESASKLEKK